MTRSRIWIILLGSLLVVVLAVGAWLSSGNDVNRATADEFIELASRGPESLYASSYIGYTRSSHESKMRVYLQVWRPRFFKYSAVDVYWTPLSEFPDEHMVEILAGGDPFTRREEVP